MLVEGVLEDVELELLVEVLDLKKMRPRWSPSVMMMAFSLLRLLRLAKVGPNIGWVET